MELQKKKENGKTKGNYGKIELWNIGKLKLWNNGKLELWNSGKPGLQIDKIAVRQDYRKTE